MTILSFTVLWLQPVIWAQLTHVDDRRMDAVLLPGVILALGSYFPLLVLGVIDRYPFLYLYYYYAGLGTAMSLIFFAFHGWRFTQALSVSALALFASSTLWEIPLLIQNAVRTGVEADWLLHAMIIFYIYWIYEYPGWSLKRWYLIAPALLLTIIVSTLYPVTPLPGTAAQWNSPPYMLTRTFSAAVIYLLINKEPKK